MTGPTRRLRALSCALAGAAVLALPGVAAAAEPGLNIGGGPGAQGDAGAFAALADTGSRWARHFVHWGSVEPAAKGAYDTGILNAFDSVVAQDLAAGASPLFVVTGAPAWASGSADPNAPPVDARHYADFVGFLAARYAGRVRAYEIWNEEDEPIWWTGAPEPARYAGLLNAAYGAIKAADPAAIVVFGPTTGNNFAFVEQVVDAGGIGFDAVGVHTDTACLTTGPGSYLRDPGSGRISRFSFLGYREVRASLLARGLDRPIWMTELGWSATQETCTRGESAGRKPGGVSEADQATFLNAAYACLGQDPFVQVALWFNQRDPDPSGREIFSYGLQRFDGSLRPAYAAFKTVARGGPQPPAGGCGDFAGPRVVVRSPVAREQFADRLVIEATSPDADVVRMTFAVRGAAREIRNFTNSGRPLDLRRNPPTLEWQGARSLPFGNHTIVVTAVDPSGNTGRVEVPVQRIDIRRLPPTATRIARLRISGSGRTRTVRGRVTSRLRFGIPGKVRIDWQARRGGRWRTIHKSSRNANRPFTVRQRLRFSGQWRARAVYRGSRPFRRSTSRPVRFRVR